jgi:diaminohydroxyphosphoribosylaminopyrimidine deaminase/5-amino-6-(5-phosphoribosylamino)uracil reductase
VHYGRTPPCTEAIIAAGIARVVVGMIDPNPVVRGRGVRQLRRAGVEVQTGVLREECERLNEDFAVWVRTGRPFVTLKLAASFDGRIATASGDAKWISGEASRRLVQKLRNNVDAVLVGAETVRIDDPQLTCRIRGGRDPVRVVLDGRLTISPEAQVCVRPSAAPTIVVTTEDWKEAEKKKILEGRGVEVWCFPATDGRVRLRAVLEALGKRGIKHVLIEGGGQIAATALAEGVVDKVLFFYGPLLLGGESRPMIGPLGIARLVDGIRLHATTVRQLGSDVVVSGYIRKERGGHADSGIAS